MENLEADFKNLTKKAIQLASLIKKQDEILVVTHIDADGITSGCIALESLKRCNIDADIIFLKQIDDGALQQISDKFVWFTDLGSGYVDLIEKYKIECVITDHHVPQKPFENQLNPHDFGYDGSINLSGSTTTYLVARNLGLVDGNLGLNYDLSAISIVGAVGDLQDSKHGRLMGLNRFVLNEAVKNGFIKVIKDLRFFGKQTRPVYKMLEYTFNPYLPGISGNEKGAMEFLESLGISLKNGEWRRWIDLSDGERRMVISEIVKVCIEARMPVSLIKKLVGESYIISYEEEGTELRDAMEYSTLLNATARYAKKYGEESCYIGLRVCQGDRDAYKKARSLLQNHRRNLSDGIRYVDEIGIVELRNIQYFHARDEIMDTIVGIVAGMCFYKANLKKPIIAFANNEDGIKVSARATQWLVEKGVHLAKALTIAAEKVGGKGGGHSIAAGATIPEGSEEKFLKYLDELIGKQLKRF
ncbi:recombinase RecJ [Archaeoglobales archaeon]|nr:MAG: recombinase RecJ [Archaeoglobales archaeon]